LSNKSSNRNRHDTFDLGGIKNSSGLFAGPRFSERSYRARADNTFTRSCFSNGHRDSTATALVGDASVVSLTHPFFRDTPSNEYAVKVGDFQSV